MAEDVALPGARDAPGAEQDDVWQNYLSHGMKIGLYTGLAQLITRAIDLSRA